MDFKDQTVGQESTEFTFLTPEDFEGLEEVEIVPYSGEGRMSFASKDSKGNSYDRPKMEYLAQIGIDTPQEWLEETGDVKKERRADFVTMFIVTGLILATEDLRRTCGEDTDLFEEILKERNRQLQDARIDKYGYRRKLPDGTLVEDHFERLNLSANPEKRVSEIELELIVGYVLENLKGKNEE